MTDSLLSGGTATQAWAFRACVIQGTQQLYIAFLWYWGSALTNNSSIGNRIASSAYAAAITMPIAVLMFIVGTVVFMGLPSYYRNQPGRVPSFYKSILHRKVVLVSKLRVSSVQQDITNHSMQSSASSSWSFSKTTSSRAPTTATGVTSGPQNTPHSGPSSSS